MARLLETVERYDGVSLTVTFHPHLQCNLISSSNLTVSPTQTEMVEYLKQLLKIGVTGDDLELDERNLFSVTLIATSLTLTPMLPPTLTWIPQSDTPSLDPNVKRNLQP